MEGKMVAGGRGRRWSLQLTPKRKKKERECVSFLIFLANTQ